MTRLSEDSVPHGDLQVVDIRGVDLGPHRGPGANLAISCSQTRYFSKRLVRRYVEWIAARFDRLLVIVADQPEVYVRHLLRRVRLDQAQTRAVHSGRQLAASYRHLVPEAFGDRVSVALASDLLCHPACAALVARLQQARAERADFRTALHDAVRASHPNKVAAATRGGSPPDASLDALAVGLIEELAILLHVSHQADPRHPVTITPHAPSPILPRLYAPPFSTLVGSVTRGEPFRSIVLAPDCGLQPLAADVPPILRWTEV
jgi:tRNA-dependent cyclodipeptide synthase